MKKQFKTGWKRILLITFFTLYGFFVLSGIVFSYFLVEKIKFEGLTFLAPRQNPPFELTITPTPTPTPIVDLGNPWTDWKDFINDKYNFSLKYPKDWYLNSDDLANIKIQNFDSLESTSDNWLGDKDDIGIYIETKKVDSSKSLEQIVDEEIKRIGGSSKIKIFSNGLVGYDVWIPQKNTIVAHLEAEYFLVDNLLFKLQVKYGENVKNEALKQYNIFVNFFKYLPLSDFKDIDKWSIYTNKEYGYEIQYPSTWIIEKLSNSMSIHFDGLRIDATEGGGSVAIRIIPKISVDEFINNKKKQAQENGVNNNYVVKERIEIELSGIKGTRIIGKEIEGIGLDSTNILLDKNDQTYLINFITGDRYLEKIATTFKFIN